MYTYQPKTTKSGTSEKKTLKAGSYVSEVLDVTFDDDYLAESMVLIKYKLTDNNGKTYSYKERFLNNDFNQRTQKFVAYLEENGVKDMFSEFLGKREKVTVKKVPQENGKVFLNIVQREFVSPEDN